VFTQVFSGKTGFLMVKFQVLRLKYFTMQLFSKSCSVCQFLGFYEKYFRISRKNIDIYFMKKVKLVNSFNIPSKITQNLQHLKKNWPVFHNKNLRLLKKKTKKSATKY